MEPLSPFPFTGYRGADYFCDRQREVEFLHQHILSFQSVTLLSKRRMGKTALLQHTLATLPNGILTLYIDLLPTDNLPAFLNLLGTAVAQLAEKHRSIKQKIGDWLKSLRPAITYDGLTGQPQLSFDFRQPEAYGQTIGSILQQLDALPQPVVIVLDEFQQISYYPETGVDTMLRSLMQQLKQTAFLFSGSQHQLMHTLFNDPSRPFYRSAALLQLGPIDVPVYAAFIRHQFLSHKKRIAEETANWLVEWMESYTYYVQLLAHRLFLNTDKEAKLKDLKQVAAQLVEEQATLMHHYRQLLAPMQWKLLKAIARQGQVTQPTAGSFLKQYDLGSSASVLRALEALIDKELIYKSTADGGATYTVYDLLLGKYIQTHYR